MNDLDAVASFQALTIYFLLRINEKDESVTTFDIPLVLTMIVRIYLSYLDLSLLKFHH